MRLTLFEYLSRVEIVVSISFLWYWICEWIAKGLESYPKFIQHFKRQNLLEVKYASLDQTIVLSRCLCLSGTCQGLEFGMGL